MSTVAPLSSYWRHRPSTILPLSSATFLNAPAASGSFITVTGDLPTTLSSIPSSSALSSSASTSSIASTSSKTSTALSATSTSIMPTSVPFSPSASSTPATSDEGVAPMSNSYKIIILSVFGALLIGMCLCLFAARLRRRSRAKKDSEKNYLDEEIGREKSMGTPRGDYGKGRWSRRMTFKTGPDKIWKRMKDYEDSVKARATNDSHIPSLPPPAITREEASFTVPTFYHGQPQGLPRGDSYTGNPNPVNDQLYDTQSQSQAKSNYVMLTRKPTVKLEPRIESQFAEERNTADMSLAEMFEVDLDGEEEDQHAISPFDDHDYEAQHFAQPQQVHALTHSLKSSSSRERINTSAYPFHPPTPAPAPAPGPAPVHLSVPETSIDPFAEDIDTSTLGNAMLSASPIPIKRKPVPTPTETLETVVPSSNLLTPDFISTSDAGKRVTYRSPTESIYGCYQADDDRSASFVDFSVSPKNAL